MTPATAAALRCPVCGGPLLLAGRSLRCAEKNGLLANAKGGDALKKLAEGTEN